MTTQTDNSTKKAQPRWFRFRVLTLPIAAALSAVVALPAPAATAAVDPPANDAITQATVIDQATLPYSASQDSINATIDTNGITDPEPTCADGPTGYTVWYQFTPTTELTARIQVTGGDWFPPTVNVYQRHGHTLNPVDCVADTAGRAVSLRAHTTYLLMLASHTERPTFTITVTQVTPPANDAITQATVIDQATLPYSASQDSTNATIDTNGITDPEPTCADGPTGYTVWYQFTPTTELTARIQVTGGDWFPPTVNVYQRHGHTLNPVDCVADTAGRAVSLRAHTTYLLMLASHTERPTFTITVEQV